MQLKPRGERSEPLGSEFRPKGSTSPERQRRDNSDLAGHGIPSLALWVSRLYCGTRICVPGTLTLVS